ncbi:MAG: glycosyltransferase family 4 protein [Drouetiella hepatica Uher 2000/2452]|jgi:glycosyltransferase involved in cell wall biosynthesis|uniref:Glycosyltransferase family 4 protein n=1 Tax=Drouetiella hepatica Uher 2000/2452 TaxID=904376 RepID=A0A951Q956_9CYAN|nr:glycosyltransferase family 4 protein [Drouetiella hepatica Uher 2000/2452]
MNKAQKNPIRVLMLGAGLDVKGGITSVEKLILQHTPPELEIEHVATFAYGSAFRNVKVFLQAVRILIQRLLKSEIDLIHIHFSERGSTLRKMLLILIASRFNKPIILHAHGATYQEFFSGLPQFVQKIVVGIFKKCTKLITLSKTWQDYYARAFQLQAKQVETLYNPVSVPLQVPQRSDRERTTFIFLGRIGKRGGALDSQSIVSFPQQDKGAFDLIHAFAALPESERSLSKLILAGNGDVELAQQKVEELNLSDSIIIHSWLSPVERDALLAAADVFVLPSYHEGLPMSMLEAMAWGLPVIVTPVGGIPEVVIHEHNGLFVEPGNQPQLTCTMQHLVNSPSLKAALGKAAREDVQALDIQNYMPLLVDIYQSVLKPSAIRKLERSSR